MKDWSEAVTVAGGLALGAAFVPLGPDAVISVMVLTLAALSALSTRPQSPRCTLANRCSRPTISPAVRNAVTVTPTIPMRPRDWPVR